MAEQFLQGTQIRSPGEQVSRETVPQCMRRQCIREAQASPGGGDGAPHEVRIEWASPRAHEQCRVATDRIRTLPNIILNRLPRPRERRVPPVSSTVCP